VQVFFTILRLKSKQKTFLTKIIQCTIIWLQHKFRGILNDKFIPGCSESNKLKTDIDYAVKLLQYGVGTGAPNARTTKK